MSAPIAFAAALALLAAACSSSGQAKGCSGTRPQALRAGQLRVGYDLTSPPLGFIDPKTDVPAGFEIDVLNEAAKRTGRKAIFVNQVVSGLLPGLLAGLYDVAASGLEVSSGLRNEVCLTDPYLQSGWSLLSAHRGPSSTSGRRIGVAGDLRIDDASSVQRFGSPADGVSALKTGRVEALVLDSATAAWYARVDKALRVTAALSGGVSYAAAVRPSNGGLRLELDRALESMRRDGTWDRIHRAWFGSGESPGR